MSLTPPDIQVSTNSTPITATDISEKPPTPPMLCRSEVAFYDFSTSHNQIRAGIKMMLWRNIPIHPTTTSIETEVIKPSLTT